MKKSRYIPKRLLARVEKMEGSKVPVREILSVLGVEMQKGRVIHNTRAVFFNLIIHALI